jgi:hypothetical protein
LRTFTSVNAQSQDQTESHTLSRAFVQWAGFTIGRAQSFSNSWAIGNSWHYAVQQNQHGDAGVNTIAYTFELGNGVTLNFGADERRSTIRASGPRFFVQDAASTPANLQRPLSRRFRARGAWSPTGNPASTSAFSKTSVFESRKIEE